MLKKYLEKLLKRQDLSSVECSEMLEIIAGVNGSTFQVGAVLAALRMKGECVAELVGGAELLRRNCNFINCGHRECVDIVGTGGDGGISFNISTTAAIVAAGAGVPIAKHGNRAVSGRSGSADMLSELGVNLNAPAEAIESCIAEHGIGFMFAPKMHPMLGKVATMRKELGIRTIFNMLGPLANPAGVKRMVVGVYDAKLTELYAAALRDLGVNRALVVHGNDGLDEISYCKSTRITELKDGNLRTFELYPHLYLNDSYDITEISGGTPKENATLAMDIIQNKNHGAPRAVVLLNAAAAIYVGGLAESLKNAMTQAEKSITGGMAFEKLQNLIEASLA